jgi:hypothetical protein
MYDYGVQLKVFLEFPESGSCPTMDVRLGIVVKAEDAEDALKKAKEYLHTKLVASTVTMTVNGMEITDQV